jgi:hypothetical protein
MMVKLTVTEIEITAMGDMASVILDKTIKPAVGMLLIDEDSETWEITATLHDKKRSTTDGASSLWTLQCKPVNATKEFHAGEYKLMH